MDEAYDCFLIELYNRAYQAFQQTDAGQLLQEQLQQMNDDIETNLSTREKNLPMRAWKPCSIPAGKRLFSPIVRAYATASSF